MMACPRRYSRVRIDVDALEPEQSLVERVARVGHHGQKWHRLLLLAEQAALGLDLGLVVAGGDT